MQVGGVRFDEIDRNVKKRGKEYDITLFNGNTLALISVKHRLQLTDVQKFLEKDIPLFKSIFPEYKDYKVYAGVAALSMDEEAKKEDQ